MKEAQEKLAAAEEASKKAAEEAKKKAREIKTAVGLARTVGPQIPSWVTHRGIGAFCVSDFSKVGSNKSNGIQPEEDKAADDQKLQESGKQSEVLPADLKQIDEETKTGMLQGTEDDGTASTIGWTMRKNYIETTRTDEVSFRFLMEQCQFNDDDEITLYCTTLGLDWDMKKPSFKTCLSKVIQKFWNFWVGRLDP